MTQTIPDTMQAAARKFAPDGLDAALLTAGGEVAEEALRAVREGRRERVDGLEMYALFPTLAKTFAAALLTLVGIFLRRAARDPRTQRGDAALLDLGFVAVTAAVLWAVVLIGWFFQPSVVESSAGAAGSRMRS